MNILELSIACLHHTLTNITKALILILIILNLFSNLTRQKNRQIFLHFKQKPNILSVYKAFGSFSDGRI